VYREDFACTLKWKEAKKLYLFFLLSIKIDWSLEYPTMMHVLKIATDTGKGNSESRGIGLFAA
jgi:hypothetical protein